MYVRSVCTVYAFCVDGDEGRWRRREIELGMREHVNGITHRKSVRDGSVDKDAERRGRER